MANKRSITSPLSIIELPQQINGLSGKFQYYAFEPDERVSIENMNSKVNYYEGSQDSIIEVPPRFIDVTITQSHPSFYNDPVVVFTQTAEIQEDAISGYVGGLYDPMTNVESGKYRDMVLDVQNAIKTSVSELIHSSTPGEGSLYFTQDFCQGFIRKTSGDGANSTQLSKSMSNVLGEKSVLDYVKSTLSGSLYTDGDIDKYEEKLMSGVNSIDDGSQLVILDPNTLLPTKEAVFDQSEAVSSDAYINSAYVQQIFRRTNESPAAETISTRAMEIAGLVEAQAEPDKEKRYLSSFQYQVFSNTTSGEGIVMKGCYFLGTESDANAKMGSMADSNLWIHVGYQVQKYIVDGENRLYRGAFLIPRDTTSFTTNFRDPYVLYGKDYYYEVRDAWCCLKTIGITSIQKPNNNLEQELRRIADVSFEEMVDIIEAQKRDLGEGVFDYAGLEDVFGADVIDELLMESSFGATPLSLQEFAKMFSDRWVPSHSLGFLILGTQTTGIDVTAREKFPPLPPNGFSFNYQGDNEIKISWNKNLKVWEDISFGSKTANVTADDVGGFLLFVRNDLLKPYELYRQFHMTTKERPPTLSKNAERKTVSTYREPFVVNVQSTIVGLVIGDNNIEYVTDSTAFDHILTLRSNVDYYIAMASYDIHGNISPYSEQFFIRKNNVTGEILTTNICGPGAPLSYPNITIPSKFVLSSMKASGYRYL